MALHSQRDVHYFKSRIFKRLFFTYILLIVVAFGAYISWYVHSYAVSYTQRTETAWEQTSAAFSNLVDQQLLSAQAISSQINASESCRNLLRTVYVEKNTVNPLQLYNMLGELSRIKGATGTRGIYNICLAFQGDNRAFLAGAVASLNDQAGRLDHTPFLGVTTVADLLHIHGSNNITLAKPFLIYGDAYTGFGQQSSVKGSVLVLFDTSVLFSLWRSAFPGALGFSVTWSDAPVLATGETGNHTYTHESAILQGLNYTVTAPDTDFRIPFPLHALMPIIFAALLGIVFVLLTFFVTRRYYKPIDDIQQMIQKTDSVPPSDGKNEFDTILQGISGLIVQRNGYREKMVTITPYAQQGMLNAMISGRAGSHAKVLIDDHFTDLGRTYYMVGIINLFISSDSDVPQTQYDDARILLRQAVAELSEDEVTVVTTPQGKSNLYTIASADARESFEGFFYTLYQKANEALDRDDCVITIGVSGIESDIERLPIACSNAERSLGQILTGGRGTVYFYEPDACEGRSYYFPNNAQQEMDKALQKRDLAALSALLDDIYRKNILQSDLPVEQIRQMADELYWTIRKSLRHVYATSPVHIQMKGIQETATIDEIFSYYHKVFETALKTDNVSEGEDLEKTVCDYIDAHVFSPDLSMNILSDQFGISAKMIGSICKKHYGQTFLSYVHDRQISRAAELLKTTSLPLDAIAEQCGFTNPLTFRRNFKAKMGVNPSEYRN